MRTVIALRGEEKFYGQHGTVTMPSHLGAALNNWVKRTVLLAFTFFLTFPPDQLGSFSLFSSLDVKIGSEFDVLASCSW